VARIPIIEYMGFEVDYKEQMAFNLNNISYMGMEDLDLVVIIVVATINKNFD
jgi:hypothetical protein